MSKRGAWRLWHPEGHVAGERAAGRYHLDLSGGRVGGHGGRDQVSRYHGERSRRAVEADAGCADQIAPQDLDGGSHLAGGRSGFHKRPKTYTQAKDRATALIAVVVGPAQLGCPVEVPIGGLDERRFGERAVRAVETAKRRQRATRGDLEDRRIGCPVEVPIGALDQPAGVCKLPEAV